MERLLQGFTLLGCLVFLCGSSMHANAIEELIHLQMLCDKLQAASVKLNPVKCSVFYRDVYLNPVISEGEETGAV